MTDGPVYGLSLIPDGNGGFVGATKASGGVGGTSSYWPASLGGAYVDSWRKDKAPSPRELIHELLGVAYACVALRADSLASAPLRLYSVKRKGGKRPKYFDAYEYRNGGHAVPTEIVPAKQQKFLRAQSHLRRKLTAAGTPGAMTHPQAGASELVEVTDHPALSLLYSPENVENDYGLSGYDHCWMTQLFLDTMGRAYWFVEKDGLGKPKNLWLLRSHFVKEVPDFTGKRLIDYFEYGGVTGMKYQPGEIVKFHVPDPYSHHYNGYGRLQAAIEKLRLLRRGDAQINALLENAGMPGLIVSPKPAEDGSSFMSAVETRKLQVALNQMLRQAGFGGTTVLPVPMDMTFPSWKPTEIVDKERYAQLKTDILNLFGIPQSFFDLNEANLASAKTGEYGYAKRSQLPMQARTEAALNKQYLPQFGDMAEGFFFAFDNPVPDDEAFALEMSTNGFQAGVLDVDEFRAAVGHEPFGDERGKQRYVSVNVTTLDGQGKPVAAADSAPTEPTEPPVKPKKPAKPKKDQTAEALLELSGEVKSLVDAGSAQRMAGGRNTDAIAAAVAEAGRSNDGIQRASADNPAILHLVPATGAANDGAALPDVRAQAGECSSREAAVTSSAPAEPTVHPRKRPAMSDVIDRLKSAGYGDAEIVRRLGERRTHQHTEL